MSYNLLKEDSSILLKEDGYALKLEAAPIIITGQAVGSGIGTAYIEALIQRWRSSRLQVSRMEVSRVEVSRGVISRLKVDRRGSSRLQTGRLGVSRLETSRLKVGRLERSGLRKSGV